MTEITLRVNGRNHKVAVDPNMPLLYVLRDDLGLRGPSRRSYSRSWSGRREIMTSLVRHLQAVVFRIGNRLSLMSPTLIIAALIADLPALAARCPQGQFYRIRLHECVRVSSPLPGHIYTPRMPAK